MTDFSDVTADEITFLALGQVQFVDWHPEADRSVHDSASCAGRRIRCMQELPALVRRL